MSDETQGRLVLRLEQFDEIGHDYLVRNEDALRLGLAGALSNGIALVTAGTDLGVEPGWPFMPSLVLGGDEFLVAFNAGWVEGPEAGGELTLTNADVVITESYSIGLVYRRDEHDRYAFAVEDALHPESQND